MKNYMLTLENLKEKENFLHTNGIPKLCHKDIKNLNKPLIVMKLNQ
jgi:hypothetical protein